MSSESLTLPAPLDLPGYIWRPAQRNDAPAIWRMAAAAVEVDGLEAAPTVENFERAFDQLGANAETDTLLALTLAGEAAAFAMFFVPPAEEEYVAQLSGNVAVDHRRRGLGRFLMTWLEARVRQRFSQLDDDKPRKIQVACRDHQEDRIRLFEKHGFRPTRYFYKMQRDLRRPIPEKQWPEGVTVVHWSPERDDATRQAFNDAFRDHWNYFPMDTEIWQRWFTGTPHFRADLSYLALDETGSVIGFNLCSVRPHQIEQTGIKEAWMDEIGVVRAWRKRGLASALIVRAMHAFKDAGADYAVSGVDTENPSGALRLYENLGFTPVKREISFTKVVE
ncbi:MAG TPA: GNAT family N-acetyltransferase [Anaerolineae bacterium]